MLIRAQNTRTLSLILGTIAFAMTTCFDAKWNAGSLGCGEIGKGSVCISLLWSPATKFMDLEPGQLSVQLVRPELAIWNWGGGNDSWAMSMCAPLWPIWLLYCIAVKVVGKKCLANAPDGMARPCIQCRYDLRGNHSGVCPECGCDDVPIPPENSIRRIKGTF